MTGFSDDLCVSGAGELSACKLYWIICMSVWMCILNNMHQRIKACVCYTRIPVGIVRSSNRRRHSYLYGFLCSNFAIFSFLWLSFHLDLLSAHKGIAHNSLEYNCQCIYQRVSFCVWQSVRHLFIQPHVDINILLCKCSWIAELTQE